MLNLIMWTSNPPLLHFDFGTGGLTGEALEHTVLEASIAACYENTLLPLARERGEQVTADEVIRAVVATAASALTPGSSRPSIHSRKAPPAVEM